MNSHNDTNTDTQTTGYACIQRYVKTLDSSPGVYRMLDGDSRVLYVGNPRARSDGHPIRTPHERSRS